jgi:hypothetical protein
VALKAVLSLDPALATHLISADRLEEKRGRLPSGIPALDQLLDGGWPRGALSELCGRRSAGRTAVLYAALAAAVARGETVALVDTGGALDPRAAMRAGIPLERLLWVRAGGGDQPAVSTALKAVDLLVAAGGFGLMGLDLAEGTPRHSRAVPDAAWLRLKRASERQGTAIIVACPWRTVGAFASAAVSMRPQRPLFATDGPALLLALEATAEIDRAATRSRQRHQACPLRLPIS